MDGARCQQRGCDGTIEDGYCNVCGHAGIRLAAAGAVAVSAAVSRPSATNGSATGASGVSQATGSAPASRGTKGSRRTNHSSTRSSRKQLGAGLVTLPDLPSTEPENAVLVDPKVPERKRFCSACNSPLKREAGFCGKCGQKYSFIPTLNPGDLVAGQYLVKGAIAYGGLGWIYLGFDNALSRYVVLKGLLNTHDVSSAAAALAERQFLAAVKHPNIVGIYNFVQQGAEGFIVMEYIGGKTLKQIRQERGPLPAAESIAYIHRILPAFSYLHGKGLVYCDFKPDNVMLEKDDVKLIDMGGVRRIEDTQGDIYGTAGYSAPEAGSGPSVESDLFTIGRTLAVLLMEIRGFSNEHQYTLPAPQDAPVLERQESLNRFLLKATAHNPNDRFESADEMADQLLGVLREVVSTENNTPHPGVSLYFGGDVLAFESGKEMLPVEPDPRLLPVPSVDAADPGLRILANATAVTDGSKRVLVLQGASRIVPESREVRLRLALALIGQGQFQEAAKLLDALGEEDAWDWRVLWFQGYLHLAQADPKLALPKFDQVYFDLPGELAPKLALGLCGELSGNRDLAIRMYDLVSRTDPGFVSAAFGLARCLFSKGERQAAVNALARVPQTSGLYIRARISAARLLIERDHAAPGPNDLATAAALAEELSLPGPDRFALHSQILASALDLIASRALRPNAAVRVLGCPLEENSVRRGLEQSLRSMAQLVAGGERVNLIDRANRVRPRTLF